MADQPPQDPPQDPPEVDEEEAQWDAIGEELEQETIRQGLQGSPDVNQDNPDNPDNPNNIAFINQASEQHHQDQQRKAEKAQKEAQRQEELAQARAQREANESRLQANEDYRLETAEDIAWIRKMRKKKKSFLQKVYRLAGLGILIGTTCLATIFFTQATGLTDLGEQMLGANGAHAVTLGATGMALTPLVMSYNQVFQITDRLYEHTVMTSLQRDLYRYTEAHLNIPQKAKKNETKRTEAVAKNLGALERNGTLGRIQNAHQWYNQQHGTSLTLGEFANMELAKAERTLENHQRTQSNTNPYQNTQAMRNLAEMLQDYFGDPNIDVYDIMPSVRGNTVTQRANQDLFLHLSQPTNDLTLQIIQQQAARASQPFLDHPNNHVRHVAQRYIQAGAPANQTNQRNHTNKGWKNPDREPLARRVSRTQNPHPVPDPHYQRNQNQQTKTGDWARVSVPTKNIRGTRPANPNTPFLNAPMDKTLTRAQRQADRTIERIVNIKLNKEFGRVTRDILNRR